MLKTNRINLVSEEHHKARKEYTDDSAQFVIVLLLACIAYGEFSLLKIIYRQWLSGWSVPARKTYMRRKMSRDGKFVTFRTTPQMMYVCKCVGLFETKFFNDNFKGNM